MPKRKAADVSEQEPRRSTRRKTTNAATQPQPVEKRAVTEKKTAATKAANTSKAKSLGKDANGGETKNATPQSEKANVVGKAAKVSNKVAKRETLDDSASTEKSYWLLKAEPESRIENGVDVKFSIDDLAAKTEPEPWDGIRNYVARNNLRAMKKGDLAFFYQSNCKEPGIVGTMEIVKEHSPDLSAHDPKAPYYDASSKPEDPKWSVVHVEFRSKFVQLIGLKELREMGKMGSPLENMQLLKQSRLSVSRVNAAEWQYLLGVAEERGGSDKTV